jgi:molybdopterin converting factor small subunit
MIKVNILFFGSTAELIGSRRVETAVSETALSRRRHQTLRAEYPSLRDHKLLSAVNEQYVAADTRLKDGYELAIFTPVSGG